MVVIDFVSSIGCLTKMQVESIEAGVEAYFVFCRFTVLGYTEFCKVSGG